MAARSRPRWTFLTNHALVLHCICTYGEMTLREIAAAVGITERAVHRIVSELVDEGYLKVGKQGRRNTYDVQRDAPMRHAATRHVPVRKLLDALRDGDTDSGCAEAA